MEVSEGSSVRAVERAAAILDALASSAGRSSLTEIAAAAKLTLPTTLRLLRTLVRCGLVLQSQDGGYILGFRILELAHALTQQLDVAAVGQSYLNAARNAVDETTVLVVRTGDYWTPIAFAEATQPVRRVMHLGERVPLYADSAGKLILAHDSDAEIERYLQRAELVPYSATTTCDPDQIRAEISRIRQRGYAWSVNARGAGGAGTAHPVYRHGGELAAALLIVCPASRFDEAAQAQYLEVAARSAQELSVVLGWRPDLSPRCPLRAIAGASFPA
ncbi:MAG: IclR family transcriptional regulator [Chloroflexota bacterium]